jgi:hypothetical protein
MSGRGKAYRFKVTLCGRKGEDDREISVEGRSMTVNHRGDLLICENVQPSGYDARVISCFRSGSWRYAGREEGE